MAALKGPFTLEGTAVEGGTVRLRYRIGDDLVFTEVVEFPFDLPDTPAVAGAIRVLHLVAGVSYYKCVAPTELVLPPVSVAERRLVVALYDQGLREFAYRNDLAVPLPVDITTASPGADSVPGAASPSGRGAPGDGGSMVGGGALVPIGGGKDSALVAALVPEGQLFAVNPVGAHEHLAAALGRPLVAAHRTLDPLLRELVARGAPNGHVPVTAITSAVSVLAAIGLGCDDVLMGIERSAEEPSLVTSDGWPINHQYSKTYEAEKLLRAVFDPVGVRYLSLLRPLTELAIGAGVALRGLATHIVSCNRVFTVWNENTSSRDQRPCGDCAKCLFTALMLAPSSTPAAIEAQFGRALLDDDVYVAPTRDLWSTAKPFDCVGERLETAAAIVLLRRTDGWCHQAVVRALAGEAQALLDDADIDPVEFLRIGALDGVPAEYRDALAGLSPDLLAVPGLVQASS